tara:strand:+ start:745 stop:1761 length:1017 start_codon:yes stop_codon:yes gene_type:complete
MKFPVLINLLSLTLLCTVTFAENSDSVIRSNDRVALIGSTLVERARLYGHLESSLHLAAGPDVQNVVFRNLGWSGDSVFGDSRAYFGTPEEGRDRLSKNISEIKPTVVLFCYGAGEAMSVDQGWTNETATEGRSADGLETSLQTFINGYQHLINRVSESAGEGLREKIFIAPPPLENHGGALPDQTENNRRIGIFRDAIRDLAERNNGRFIDLFHALGGDEFDGSATSNPLTNNGLHYTEAGYRVLSREIVKGLGYAGPVVADEDDSSLAEFRKHIIEKNRLFFNRWRPTNETYLFLFRAHEQGQNAKEIPMYDPIIAEEEQLIAQARRQVLTGQPKN